jgi:hypothetical protein
LLGKIAWHVEAIAEAFRIAKGFFPVTEFPEPATKFVVPLVLVLEDRDLAEDFLLYGLGFAS